MLDNTHVQLKWTIRENVNIFHFAFFGISLLEALRCPRFPFNFDRNSNKKVDIWNWIFLHNWAIALSFGEHKFSFKIKIRIISFTHTALHNFIESESE